VASARRPVPRIISAPRMGAVEPTSSKEQENICVIVKLDHIQYVRLWMALGAAAEYGQRGCAMELLIRIHQGQIIAGSTTVQKCRLHSFDASCDFPVLHGRPGFNKAAFQAMLAAEIGRLRGSVRSLAA
jgi:hypothetical protein